jgi:hypothetical protein
MAPGSRETSAIELLYGMISTLDKQNEGLLTTTTYNFESMKFEPFLQYFLLVPSLTGECLLARSIAVREQLIAVTSEVLQQTKEISREALEVVSDALSSVDKVDFDPFEYQNGFHRIIREWVSQCNCKQDIFGQLSSVDNEIKSFQRIESFMKQF